jgi:predicted negative regulator of RcsB-dependent stress response
MNIETKLYSIVIPSIIAAAVIITATNFNPIAFAQGNIHLDAAAKALESGDTKGALTHMNEADKTLTGAAKMHLDAAISALESGDTSGASMHLQVAQKNQ